MTFTSPRNHQTTPRTTGRRTESDRPRWLILASLALLGVATLPLGPLPLGLTSLRAEEGQPPVEPPAQTAEQAADELPDSNIPSDAEIDEQLRLLDQVSNNYATGSAEEVKNALTQLGSQIPDDLQPYPEPATDPSQLNKIVTIKPWDDPPNGEELPEEIHFGQNVAYLPRANPHAHYYWDASDMFSNPLYFEDANLERYGYTYPFLLQPFVSVGKFSGQLALLPYQMVNNPIRKEVYVLGNYRPGEWAPRLWYQVPFNMKAAAVQAGALTGMIFLIP